MVVGILSLVQKGQIHATHSTQYAVCSEIVVHGDGDIVFSAIMVNPMQYSVKQRCIGHCQTHAVNAGTRVQGGVETNTVN